MQIPKDYPLVLAAGLGMGLQCWWIGTQISRFRRKTFNKQFMEKISGEIHQQQLGWPIEAGGYPDTGSGRYSSQLSYSQWYQFNVLQRNHLNYVEGINLATLSLLGSGLYQPKVAAWLGLVYILSRFTYTIGYQKKGGATNKLRMAGVLAGYLAILGNIGIVAYNVVQHLKK